MRGTRPKSARASPHIWLTLFQILSKSVHFRRSYCQMREDRFCPIEYLQYRLFEPIIIIIRMHCIIGSQTCLTYHQAPFVLNVINLSFMLDKQLTSLSKACYCHIRQLHCIRLNLDLSTACTIAKFWIVAFDNLS